MLHQNWNYYYCHWVWGDVFTLNIKNANISYSPCLYFGLKIILESCFNSLVVCYLIFTRITINKKNNKTIKKKPFTLFEKILKLDEWVWAMVFNVTFNWNIVESGFKHHNPPIQRWENELGDYIIKTEGIWLNSLSLFPMIIKKNKIQIRLQKCDVKLIWLI